MLQEPDLEVPGKLLHAIVELMKDPQHLSAMSSAARSQAHPAAAEQIADRLAELAGTKAS
jgi:UDP-N-acetylglucosamine--N-acetylmuramyl-(pentapeptide) pyrophosphoryl-undecaprenol N-acetylglucosamine transferase